MAHLLFSPSSCLLPSLRRFDGSKSLGGTARLNYSLAITRSKGLQVKDIK